MLSKTHSSITSASSARASSVSAFAHTPHAPKLRDFGVDGAVRKLLESCHVKGCRYVVVGRASHHTEHGAHGYKTEASTESR
jgi:hypothetical protein